MAGHWLEFGLMPELVKAVEDMGWMLPTDIQSEACPLILNGGDVLMAAETGSGKTGAFCLPVMQIVHEAYRSDDAASTAAPAGKRAKTSAPVTMNPADRDTFFAIGPNGLLCQSREEHKWQGCRANAGVTKGKHYFEALMTDEGLCRIGWSTRAAGMDLGTDKQGFGFGGTGKKSFGRQFDDYGEPHPNKGYKKDDVLGCCIDLEASQISYSKNGTDLGVAFEIPPQLQRAAFYPACVIKNAELQFNFGATPFKHPPAGRFAAFTGLEQAEPDQRVNANASAGKATKGRTPLAIIIEPSKELAQQVYDQIRHFKKHMPAPALREVLLIGGTKTKDSLREIAQGCEIVVATPGRLDAFVQEGKLDVSQVRFFVLDEVDGLLKQGQGKFLEGLYARIPKSSPDGTRMQMIVASATLHSPDVKRLADKLMYHPVWVDLKGQTSVPETVHHVVAIIDPVKDRSWRNKQIATKVKHDFIHDKDNSVLSGGGENSKEALSFGVKSLKHRYLLKLIEVHKPDQGIIFARTKLDCDNIEKVLNAQGGGGFVNEYSCCCLHSDRNVQERKENLQKFKNGEARFLICTDVAARGIDVQGIPFVVNVTMPDEKENYVHRIGRVGRADRMGLAVSLVSSVEEKVWYCSCGNRKLPCKNNRLKHEGGCCIWYNEPQLLKDVEEHLGETISVCPDSMEVPTNEFDGKVVYGEKKSHKSAYEGHVDVLRPAVADLHRLEVAAQESYLRFGNRTWA